MAARKKTVASSRGTAALKMSQAAEQQAVKAHAQWAKAIAGAVTVTEKELNAVAKKAVTQKSRASKAMTRVKNAKGPAAKAKAREARKAVLTNLAAVNAELAPKRVAHAAAQADLKLFKLVDKALAAAMKAAEKAATKAAKPKKRRRSKKAA